MIVAAGIVTKYEWQPDLRFMVRLDIRSYATENYSPDILTSQSFSVEDAEGAVNAGIHTFLAGYIVSEWGMTFDSATDTITVINPYRKAPASAILSSKFTAFWKLDEASGTRADSIGENDLTEVGTVLQANPGFIGSAAQFTPNDYLTIDDSPDLVSGPFDFFISGWFSPNQNLADECLFSSRNRTLDRPVYELWRLTTGQLEIRAHNGTTLDTYPTTFYMDPGQIGGQWDFVLFEYISALGMFIVQMNELPAEVFAHVPLTDSNRLSIGGDGAVTPTGFQGRIDAFGYGRTLITGISGLDDGGSDHRILWNYGEGQEWPFDEVSFTLAQAQNVQVCRLAEDHTNSTTTKTDMAGMFFTLEAYTLYSIEFTLLTTANADTVGVQFAITFAGAWGTGQAHYANVNAQAPGSPTSLLWLNAGGAWPEFPLNFDFTTSQGNVPGTVKISGTIEVNAAGGILQLQHGSETATLTTVLRGSWGMCARHSS